MWAWHTYQSVGLPYSCPLILEKTYLREATFKKKQGTFVTPLGNFQHLVLQIKRSLAHIWRSKRTNACKPHENVTAPFPVMVYIKLLWKSSTLWRKFPWFFGQWSETVGWWEHISYTSFTFNQWQATSCDQGNTPPTQLSPSMTNNIWRSKRTNACKPHKAIESATDMAHNTFEGLW